MFRIAEKKRAFLDLLLLAAREGADLSDSNIQNEVDTFMFAVRNWSPNLSSSIAIYLSVSLLTRVTTRHP